MILQSLMTYYEALAEKGEIVSPGWGNIRVQYALEINDAGSLQAVLPLESLNEKGKPNARYFSLPAPVKRTAGISSNFLWDNAAYLLGFDSKGNPARAKQCFEDAKKLHLTLLSEIDAPFAKAICSFFETWTPEKAQEAVMVDCLEKLRAGANLTFMYNGCLPDSDSALKAAWQTHYDGAETDDGAKMRCLITGMDAQPELTHPSIKNVRGAQSVGASLVSFNAPAFCSFGREQNLNAPVSKYAAFAYTTALNHLLAHSNHVRLFGDTTVVYWAETAESQYQDVFGCSLDGDTVTDNDLTGVMDALAKGSDVYWSGLPVKADNHFYVIMLVCSVSVIL